MMPSSLVVVPRGKHLKWFQAYLHTYIYAAKRSMSTNRGFYVGYSGNDTWSNDQVWKSHVHVRIHDEKLHAWLAISPAIRPAHLCHYDAPFWGLASTWIGIGKVLSLFSNLECLIWHVWVYERSCMDYFLCLSVTSRIFVWFCWYCHISMFFWTFQSSHKACFQCCIRGCHTHM